MYVCVKCAQSFTLILDDMTRNNATFKPLLYIILLFLFYSLALSLTFILPHSHTLCVSLSLLNLLLLTLSVFAGSLPKWVVNKSSHYLAPRVSNLQINTDSVSVLCVCRHVNPQALHWGSVQHSENYAHLMSVKSTVSSKHSIKHNCFLYVFVCLRVCTYLLK